MMAKKVWDRRDAEERYIKEYLTQCREAEIAPVITFALRNGKTIAGQFVELGQFIYVVNMPVGGETKRVIIPKHTVDYIILGKADSTLKQAPALSAKAKADGA